MKSSKCPTCAVLAADGVAPVPVPALGAAVAGRVVLAQQALAREAVAGARVAHVDVPAAAARLAVAANLPRVAVVTRGTTVWKIFFYFFLFIDFFNNLYLGGGNK